MPYCTLSCYLHIMKTDYPDQSNNLFAEQIAFAVDEGLQAVVKNNNQVI